MNEWNSYQKCLYSVSNILIQYDSDQLVPVYGFGCKLNGNTSHCYPIHQDFMCNDGFYGMEQIMNG